MQFCLLLSVYQLEVLELEIAKAKIEDLPEILALQRAAYISEAKLVNRKEIQPLTQTLEELEQQYKDGIILKAIKSGKIIGSVRGYTNSNTLYIGKLMVHPDYQNQGIGKQLLFAIEKYFPDYRYELFTNENSIKNIFFYQRNGYKEYKRETDNDELVMVFLEK